ncbi:hypothetical protein [Actinoplanes sp. NPDC049599]|uniref:hypothetical protein n=1 Tax=Actinoplanes sp. NPDC049599 TaxID=3363903 RepID=UPI00379202AC
MAGRVFLHVGAPKTGSTYVQDVLWSNRDALRRAGLLLPGTAAAHDQAMTDLRAVPWRDPGATWTWDRLAAEAARWPGDVIISNEALGGATGAQVARAVHSLRPAEVHVIVVARDLWRTFPSMWQQSIRERRVWRFETFLRAVERGEFETFWELHTANRMLRRWGDEVPPERRHLVTVPAPGAPPDTLWQRFAGVLGIPDGLCVRAAPTANASLGAAETELLRRVNQALGDRYPHRRPYQQVVQRHLVNAVLKRRPDQARFTVGPDRAGWVLDLAEQQIKELDEYPCQVVGDLAELRPAGVRPAAGPDELNDAQVLAVALETIVGLLGHAESLAGRADRDGLLRRLRRRLRQR